MQNIPHASILWFSDVRKNIRTTKYKSQNNFDPIAQSTIAGVNELNDPCYDFPSFDVKIKLLYEMYKKVFAAFESLQRNNIPMFYSKIASSSIPHE